ncbi:hypothetical protein [Brevundimonas sp.]|jgi:uncharacterized lipoprotein YajG|uniref:hypothetical protein n=1 Tax=Brevundimonas sp. TaxID=1871086 RepID=UPI0035B21B95
MTPTTFLNRIALIACAVMTTSCAASRQTSTVAPARLLLPEAATRPCALAVLPAGPTVADLEAAYVLRGSQIVACDGARRLAVETLLAERALQDRQGRGEGD